MSNLYCCYTNYHLLITLLKAKNNDKLLLFDKITDVEKKLQIFNKYNLFSKIYIKNQEDISFEFVKKQYIYIYNDFTKLGEYLRKNKISYNLLEDGYNCFSINLLKIYYNPLKIFLKFLLCKNNMAFGYSEYAKSIEVNNKYVIIKDCRYKKITELPRKNLFKNLSEERKNIIFEIFDFNMIDFGNKKSVLILTQPIYQDGIDKKIKTEKEQFNFYNDIVKKYRDNYVVYFKIHPRDSVDYSYLNDITFLNKDTPIELYEFIEGCKFDIGITHSSTALDYLSCVGKKIFLGNIKY